MPVVRDIPLNLNKNSVLRREGFRKHSGIRPEIKDLVSELLTGVEETHLLQSAVAYEIYPIIGISPEQLVLEGDAVVKGSLLPSLMPEAKELAVAVCTIGPGLEKQVTGYTNGGETLRGVLLDGIGSTAVDSLEHEACRFIAGEVSSRGYQVSSPVSPGMPGLSITEQWRVLGLVPSGEIGVSLTSAGIMVPRKSTSMVIGIGPKVPTWTQAQVCAACNLSTTCPYRINA
ncbi:hypothetical protein ACFLW0_00865 [Chloroflexota bacterium]